MKSYILLVAGVAVLYSTSYAYSAVTLSSGTTPLLAQQATGYVSAPVIDTTAAVQTTKHAIAKGHGYCVNNAYSLLHSGDTKKALFMARQAYTSAHTPNEKAAALLCIAEIDDAMGNTNEAKTYYRYIIRHFPSQTLYRDKAIKKLKIN